MATAEVKKLQKELDNIDREIAHLGGERMKVCKEIVELIAKFDEGDKVRVIRPHMHYEGEAFHVDYLITTRHLNEANTSIEYHGIKLKKDGTPGKYLPSRLWLWGPKDRIERLP